MKNRPSLTSEQADAAAAGRRSLLTMGISVSLAAAFICVRSVLAAGCTDPDDLSGADAALRKSVEYADFSSDEKKTCRGCAFFKAGTGPCGTCQILSGLVNADGHCTSWSAK
jgi:hypothetical protein